MFGDLIDRFSSNKASAQDFVFACFVVYLLGR